MDISEIRDRYNNRHYDCSTSIPLKLKEDYVFDENLSVKRNRELIAEHNQKVEDMRREKISKQAELNEQLKEDVVDYIVDTYDINRAQAYFVESFCYVEKHSYMGDYFSHIDEVADMVENVLKASNN